MEQKQLTVETQGQGLYAINSQISKLFSWPPVGMLNLFIQHTSASLVIQENADPTAKMDLEHFINLLVPENQSWHRHTLEGPDDTTSHLKAAITQTSLSIPIVHRQLGLGSWQGVYVWEHRNAPHRRKIIATLQS